MRLFKVESAWENNAELTEDKLVFVSPEDPHVRVGEHSIPLSKGLVEDMKGPGPHPLLVVGLTPAPEPPPPIEGEPPRPLLPLSTPPPPERKLIRPKAGELERAREGRDYGPALVHVRVPPYPGGRLRFRSTMFVEKVVPGNHCEHIEREYLWLHEGEGLRVVAMRGDEQEALIEFLPNAALRVEHEDAFVPPGESPVLIITWSGKELRVFRPQKFQKTPLRSYRR